MFHSDDIKNSSFLLFLNFFFCSWLCQIKRMLSYVYPSIIFVLSILLEKEKGTTRKNNSTAWVFFLCWRWAKRIEWKKEIRFFFWTRYSFFFVLWIRKFFLIRISKNLQAEQEQRERERERGEWFNQSKSIVY